MMHGQALIDRLGDRLAGLRGRLTPNAEMDKITWFRAGGQAKCCSSRPTRRILPRSCVRFPKRSRDRGRHRLEPLVRDGGIPGFVIRLSAKGFGEAEVIGPTTIKAGAATPDKRVAAVAYEAGIGGFHFYHGIPGPLAAHLS